MHAFLFLFFSSICFSLHLMVVASQPLPCPLDDDPGYPCKQSHPPCETLAYFRAQTSSFSSSLSNVAHLFNTTTSAIANASGLSSLSPDLKPGEGLYIPFTCTCNGNTSSQNTTYTILPGDTFMKIGSLPYEGLTTCQAIQNANPDSNAFDLGIGNTLILPLRCSCPSSTLQAKGIKLFVTYPVGSVNETIFSVTDMFGVDRDEFLSVNQIENASQSLPAVTTVLLPFKEKPTLPPNVTIPTSPKIPPSPTSPTSPDIKVRIVASATTIGITMLIIITVAASCAAKKIQRKRVFEKPVLRPNAISSPIVQSPQSGKSQVNLSQGMSNLATTDRLIIYTIDEIYQATHCFHISTRIKGAVYRGTIKGRDVAVKIVERDVLKEVQILQMLHHCSIISLLGFCTASPYESYLVYEYAAKGSLHDLLHGHVHGQGSSQALACRDRLQIALDIAFAMEYIHDHTHPRFVHNNINSNNILVDSKMRGKMTNFALAIAIDDNIKLHSTHCQALNEDYTSHEHVMHTKVLSKLTSHEHVMHTKESSKVTSHEDEMHNKVSPEVDVYAFGEVLLQMLETSECEGCEAGGLLAAGMVGKESLKAWVDICIEDNELHTECAYAVAALARSCLAHDASARDVAFTLCKLLENCTHTNQNTKA